MINYLNNISLKHNYSKSGIEINIQPYNKSVLFINQQDTNIPEKIYQEKFDSVKTATRQSFFTTQSQNHSLQPERHNYKSNSWITILLILGFVLFVYVCFKYRNRLRQIFRAFARRNYANQFVREGNLFKEKIFIPLMAISFISLSIFYYQTIKYFYSDIIQSVSDFGLFIIIFTAILSIWILKIILIRITAFIFLTQKHSYEYLLNMHIFFIACGLIVLPILLLTTYCFLKIFLFIGLVISTIIFLAWIIRGVSIGLNEKNFSKFHLFLYLCTFEFIPVLILLKAIIDRDYFF